MRCTDFTIICNQCDEDIVVNFIENLLDKYSSLTFGIQYANTFQCPIDLDAGHFFIMKGNKILTREEMGLDAKK